MFPTIFLWIITSFFVEIHAKNVYSKACDSSKFKKLSRCIYKQHFIKVHSICTNRKVQAKNTQEYASKCNFMLIWGEGENVPSIKPKLDFLLYDYLITTMLQKSASLLLLLVIIFIVIIIIIILVIIICSGGVCWYHIIYLTYIISDILWKV